MEKLLAGWYKAYVDEYYTDGSCKIVHIGKIMDKWYMKQLISIRFSGYPVLKELGNSFLLRQIQLPVQLNGSLH